MIREGYRSLLRWCPLSYDALFTITDRSPPLVAMIGPPYGRPAGGC